MMRARRQLLSLAAMLCLASRYCEGQGFDPQPEDYAEFVDTIKDPNTPLPSCEEIGVFEAWTCKALCDALEAGTVDLSRTRDVNGEYSCYCTEHDGCTDRPTCGQLNIQPGRVEEGCRARCGNRYTASVDRVEFAGDISAANKDMTHFVMECRCDGAVECSDYVLFSDLDLPTTCSSLGVNSTETCDNYCETEGGGLFDLAGNYTLDERDRGTCVCRATSGNAQRDVDIAPACTDIPKEEVPQACSLQDNCDEEENGGGDGSVSLSVALTLLSGVWLSLYGIF